MDNILKKSEFSPIWTKFIFGFFGYLTILGVLFGIFVIGRRFSGLLPIPMLGWGVDFLVNFVKVGWTIGQFVIVALALQLIMLNYRKEKRVESIALSVVYISAAVVAVILSEDLKGTDIQIWASIKAFLTDDIFLYNILNQVLIQFILIVFILQLISLRRQQEVGRASVIVSAITVILGVASVIFLLLFDLPTIPVTAEGTDQVNLIVVITAISGLITAISGLYGQILAGKKLRAEIELLSAQKQLSGSSTRLNKKTGRTSSKKRGKE